MGSRVCVCNDNCDIGEVCSGAPGKSYCFSERLVDRLTWATSIPCYQNPQPSPELPGSTVPPPTTAAPPVKISGLTGDACRLDDNCRSGRTCIAGGGDDCETGNALCDKEQRKCEVADRDCYCYDLARCNCNDDCSDTELCTFTKQGRICVAPQITLDDDALSSIPCSSATSSDPILIVNEAEPEPPAQSSIGISGERSPEPGQDEDPACIDAEALTHFESHHLVYPRHQVRPVLCDSHGSCATPGHIVVYQEKAMMMASYCEIVSCSENVIPVNSPRFMKRRLRIASRTDGLQFTAFAAKYQTVAEEIALSAAVRIGL